MSGRAAVLWPVARQPGLPRLEAAFAAFAVAEHATWLAILVYAYQRGGVRLARGPRVAPGARRRVVCREGQYGEAYYLVEHGELRVDQQGEMIRRLGPGGAFGEIALLYDVPRTATVTALSAAGLLVVHRRAFLDAVTGRPSGLAAAHEVATRLLAR